MSVRTRIAPSPTGFLHIGTARTALFNYLFAKKHGGAFMLRIEDTDLERSDKKFEQDIFESLRWLGIVADENPEVGGPYAPYRQSERLETYEKYLQQLLDSRKAIYCFHEESELAASGGSAEGKIFEAHVCEHKNISRPEAEARVKRGDRGIIRFRNDRTDAILFNDLIRGKVQFDASLLGDFSLAKDLRTPLYNFAVVIDDREMQISHVIRGEDHISNTPKQLLISDALGFSHPEFAHLPLILGADRSKLSKRHGATSIREFREQGYLPEALVNFMALLGWNPDTDQEFFTLPELIPAFDLAKVQKSGAVFNIDKLDATNGEYIRKKSVRELTKLIEPFLEPAIPEYQNMDRAKLEAIVALEQPRLKKLSEIGAGVSFFFREPAYDPALLAWKNISREEIRASLERTRVMVGHIVESDFIPAKLEKTFLAEIGAGDKGRVLWPLRVALSGKKASPGPFDIMAILGKGECLRRLDQAIEVAKHP